MFSYLNGRTTSSSNGDVKLWPNEDRDQDISNNGQISDSQMGTGTNANANAAYPDDTGTDALATSNSTPDSRNNTFDANDWKDIGKAENYVLYINKIRTDKQRNEKGAKNKMKVSQTLIPRRTGYSIFTSTTTCTTKYNWVNDCVQYEPETRGR